MTPTAGEIAALKQLIKIAWRSFGYRLIGCRPETDGSISLTLKFRGEKERRQHPEAEHADVTSELEN